MRRHPQYASHRQSSTLCCHVPSRGRKMLPQLVIGLCLAGWQPLNPLTGLGCSNWPPDWPRPASHRRRLFKVQVPDSERSSCEHDLWKTNTATKVRVVVNSPRSRRGHSLGCAIRNAPGRGKVSQETQGCSVIFRVEDVTSFKWATRAAFYKNPGSSGRSAGRLRNLKPRAARRPGLTTTGDTRPSVV